MSEKAADGVHRMVPEDRMTDSARKLRATYRITPGAPFYREEFGFFTLERWAREGRPADVPLADQFHFDPPVRFALGGLGWCEAAFAPPFEEKLIEDRGSYEVVQDRAGRHVLCFKGRRQGFMPEYLDHPVKDHRSWEEDVKWRLDPKRPQRYADLAERMSQARQAASQGLMIQQQVIGGYMYLRSLMGPEDVLYAFYDMPELIHDCMQVWLDLADAVTACHQQYVTFDELYVAEDICYNRGPLISPEMMEQFLFPYYQQLIDNIRSRQIDRQRHLYIHIDTDGYALPVIDLYRRGGHGRDEPV